MNENNNTPTVALSVKDLVAFVMRSGSIDNRFGGFDRAQEGARIHRQLQKAAGPGYEAEVTLKEAISYRGVTFQIQGRADGIIRQDGGITIDEIKTVSRSVMALEESDYPDYWAQARCYAFLIARKENLARVTVRLTYYQVGPGTVRTMEQTWSREKLEDFFWGLLDTYVWWVEKREGDVARRDASISGLAFPFEEYRRGQREMALAVYKTIRSGGPLFCQAPTGIGKTMAALYAAVQALGSGLAGRIFYATAKTTNAVNGEKALDQLRERGLAIKSVTLTAKDKICFLEERSCNPEDCPYAEGYYDRVDAVLRRMLCESDRFDRETVEAWGREQRLCPFELSLDLAQWADVVIGDYNYIFDPVVSMERLFAGNPGEWVYLIDESHNLADRTRSMYSETLRKSWFLELKRALPKSEKGLGAALRRVNESLIALRKAQDTPFTVQKEPLSALNEELLYFFYACEAWLRKGAEGETAASVLDLYFTVRHYLEISGYYDDGCVTTVSCQRSEVTVSQRCLDPAERVRDRTVHCRSAVFFSATLTPMAYYVGVLGGDEATPRVSLPSPFDPARFSVLVADRVSTKYVDREASLTDVAALIGAFVGAREGHYLVFFPSYAYMEAVAAVFREAFPEIDLIVQDPSMSEEERQAFLRAFGLGDGDASSDAEGGAVERGPFWDGNGDSENKAAENRSMADGCEASLDGCVSGVPNDASGIAADSPKQPPIRTLAGFCVLGGFFGEGIDLAGDRLIGVVIVGVGLPKVGRDQDLLRDYYEETRGMGFDYAYRFPGMNKVLQAMGRVIRTPEDRGLALLIDSRFAYSSYQSLFPGHLRRQIPVADAAAVRQEAVRFWEKKK